MTEIILIFILGVVFGFELSLPATVFFLGNVQEKKM